MRASTADNTGIVDRASSMLDVNAAIAAADQPAIGIDDGSAVIGVDPLLLARNQPAGIVGDGAGGDQPYATIAVPRKCAGIVDRAGAVANDDGGLAALNQGVHPVAEAAGT